MNLPAPTESNIRRPLNRRLDFWIFVLITIVLFILVRHYRYHNEASHQRHSAALVQVAPVTTADVPVYLSALGNVTPTYTITVKTQINGQLLRVLFKEGQMVKVGQVLAEIDPRPYEAQLMQYTGQLERDEALLANARLDLQRYQTLWKQNSVAKQTLDTQVALVHQYEGSVKLDQGLIATTQLNLVYCHITAPVNGRIGLRLVDPGNFVQTADTSGLFIIDTLDPITVIFTVAEDYIPDIIHAIYADKKFIVKAYDRQQNKLLATGTLLTMDNQIDPTTGTVKLRASFPNDHNILFPSQFVNVKLLVKILQNATIVPTAAIQYSVKDPYVFILNQNQTVSIRSVKLGVTVGDETVVTEGISVGQQVITEGVDQLTEGVKVTLAAKTLPSFVRPPTV